MSTPTNNQKLMERVRALLAQAEHPNTGQAEAEAFTARAAELMAKYGMDAALLAERTDHRETVVGLVIRFDQPYAREKCSVLSAVARPMRCKTIRHTRGKTVTSATVFGFPSDLERVQVLYTSLLLQATRDVVRAQVPYYDNVAAYRRTWLCGFAAAVSSRLTAAEQRAQNDAEQDKPADGSRSVALVLADRTADVDSAVDAAFPRLRQPRARRLSGGGMRDGLAAGRRADIGGTRIGGAARPSIGGRR